MYSTLFDRIKDLNSFVRSSALHAVAACVQYDLLEDQRRVVSN